MKIGLEVSFNDGTTKKVESVFADFVAFERTWNRSVTQFENELRLTDLAWLAWNCEKRRLQSNMLFDPDWILTVTNIVVGDENEPDIPLTVVEAHTD